MPTSDNETIIAGKFEGLSDVSIKPETMSDKSLAPKMTF